MFLYTPRHEPDEDHRSLALIHAIMLFYSTVRAMFLPSSEALWYRSGQTASHGLSGQQLRSAKRPESKLLERVRPSKETFLWH